MDLIEKYKGQFSTPSGPPDIIPNGKVVFGFRDGSWQVHNLVWFSVSREVHPVYIGSAEPMMVRGQHKNIALEITMPVDNPQDIEFIQIGHEDGGTYHNSVISTYSEAVPRLPDGAYDYRYEFFAS